MGIELYHFPASLCSQKARLVLNEKGVPWDGHVVNILKGDNLKPDYMTRNRRGVVPTLVHDGKAVTDSLAILRYVSRNFTGPDLEAGNSGLIQAWLLLQDRMPIRQLTYARAKGLRGWLMRAMVPWKRKKAARLATRVPSLKEAYREKLADIEVWEAGLKDEKKTQADIALVEGVLDVMEATLKKQRWLAGDSYTLADIAWTPVLLRLEQLGLSTLWETGKRQEVTRYFAHLKRRPSYEKEIVLPGQNQKKYLISTLMMRFWWVPVLLLILITAGLAALFAWPQIAALMGR